MCQVLVRINNYDDEVGEVLSEPTAPGERLTPVVRILPLPEHWCRTRKRKLQNLQGYHERRTRLYVWAALVVTDTFIATSVGEEGLNDHGAWHRSNSNENVEPFAQLLEKQRW